MVYIAFFGVKNVDIESHSLSNLLTSTGSTNSFTKVFDLTRLSQCRPYNALFAPKKHQYSPQIEPFLESNFNNIKPLLRPDLKLPTDIGRLIANYQGSSLLIGSRRPSRRL
jgi:hypothetical protein